MKTKFLNQLIINSKDRRTGENLNNCNFDKLLNISHCDCFAVKELMFVNNIYPINQYNNQLTIGVGMTTGTVTITPGNYNSSQLLTEVVTQLNTLGFATVFSASFNNITNKVTLNSTLLNIISLTGNLAIVLGFTTAFIAGLTITGNVPINISQTPYIRFTSNELMKYNKPNMSTDLSQSHLYLLNNNQYAFGSSINIKEQDPTTQLINWQRDNLINNFDIKVYDASNNLADLNNSEWQIVLNFYQKI